MPKKRKPAFDDLISALNSPDVDTQMEAMEALAELGDPRAVEPLLALFREPTSESDENLMALLYDLLMEFDEDAAPAILRLFETGTLPQKNFAAELLGDLEWEEAIPAALRLFQQPEPEGKAIAAQLLGVLQAEEAFAPLHSFIESQSDYIRSRSFKEVIDQLQQNGKLMLDIAPNDPLIAVPPTLQALAELDSYQAYPILTGLFTGQDGLLDPYIIDLVAPIEEVDVVPWLLSCLGDARVPVVMAALAAIKPLDDERIIPGLIALLNHPFPPVRIEAIDGLGLIGDEIALDALQSLTPNPEHDSFFDIPAPPPDQQAEGLALLNSLTEMFGGELVEEGGGLLEEMILPVLDEPSLFNRLGMVKALEAMGLSVPPGLKISSEAELIARSIEEIEARLSDDYE